MRKTKGINLKITTEEFVQICNQQAEDSIKQLTEDHALRELITGMGVDPDEIASMIKEDKLELDKMNKPK